MKSKAQVKNKPANNPKLKRFIWIVVLIAGLALTAFLLWKRNNNNITSPSDTVTTRSVNAMPKSETAPLVGRWVRTDSDGGYTIEIKGATADGKLDAHYFNPSSINVGHAEWVKKDNGLVVIVELRDTNYPGSTYTLNFLPTEDQMIGTYYQAIEGTNYNVQFTRIR